MLARQDGARALELLIVQRRLYSRAKRCLGLRWFGMLVIGLSAPLVSVLYPSLAVWSGAIAGLWIFFGRTGLVFAESSTTAKAAALQEQFDLYVFAMPSGRRRTTMPSFEQISRLAGPDDQLKDLARRENLFAWYPINPADPGGVSVAISQRANAAYAEHLIRTTAMVWTAVTVIWLIVLILFSALTGLTLLVFLSGVLLPVLPAFLDVSDFVGSIWRSSSDRRDLARDIEEGLQKVKGVEPRDLLEWQARLYYLRRSTPTVPDFIYGRRRELNEEAMRSAARQLGDNAKDASP